MEQSELLKHVCRLFEQLGVRYLITGSHATIAYGEPRFTNDIDVVAELTPANLDAFCAAFPDSDFYLSRQAAEEAVCGRGMFNIIHPSSGLKVDVIIPKQTPHDELRFSRGIRIPVDDAFKAVFTSPEDIILKKLQWHEMGQRTSPPRHCRRCQDAWPGARSRLHRTTGACPGRGRTLAQGAGNNRAEVA